MENIRANSPVNISNLTNPTSPTTNNASNPTSQFLQSSLFINGNNDKRSSSPPDLISPPNINQGHRHTKSQSDTAYHFLAQYSLNQSIIANNAGNLSGGSNNGSNGNSSGATSPDSLKLEAFKKLPFNFKLNNSGMPSPSLSKKDQSIAINHNLTTPNNALPRRSVIGFEPHKRKESNTSAPPSPFYESELTIPNRPLSSRSFSEAKPPRAPLPEQSLTPLNRAITEGSVTSISILPYSPLVSSVSVSPILTASKHPSAFATSPAAKNGISAISLEPYSPLVSPIRARSDSSVSTDGNFERRYIQQDLKNKIIEVVSLQPFSPLAHAASPKSPSDPTAAYTRSNSIFPSISSEISVVNRRPDGSSTSPTPCLTAVEAPTSIRQGSVCAIGIQQFSPMIEAITDSPLIKSNISDKSLFSNFTLDQITPKECKSYDGPLTPASFNMKRYPESEPLTPEFVLEGSVASIGFAQFSPLVSAVAQSPAKVQRSNSVSDSANFRRNSLKAAAFKNLSINSETPNPAFGSLNTSKSLKTNVDNNYPIGPSPMTPSSFGLARWPTSENDGFPVGLSPMNNSTSIVPTNLTRFSSFSGSVAPNTPLTPASFGLNRWPSSELATEHLTPMNKSGNTFFSSSFPSLDCIGKENLCSEGPLTPASFGLKSWPSSEFAVEHLASAPSTPQINCSAHGKSVASSSPFSHYENKVPLSPASFGLKRFPSSESDVDHLTPVIKTSKLSTTVGERHNSTVDTDKINEGTLASIGIQPYSPFVAPVTQSPIFSGKSANCELPFSPTFATSSYPSISDSVSLSERILARPQSTTKKAALNKDNIEKDIHPRSIFDTLNSNNQQLLSQITISNEVSPTTIMTVTDLTSCLLENPLPSITKTAAPPSIKELFNALPENERMLIRCIWVMCGKLESSHLLQFFYRCLEFHRSGYLSNLDFLGIGVTGSNSNSLALPGIIDTDSTHHFYTDSSGIVHCHKSCFNHSACITSRVITESKVTPPPSLASIDEISSLFCNMNPTERILFDDLFVSDFHQQFKVISKLGKGSFGKVYKCLKKLDGRFYALKVIRFASNISSDVVCQKQLREVQILAALPVHKNIVRYFHSWLEADMGSHNDIGSTLKPTPAFVSDDTTPTRFASFPTDSNTATCKNPDEQSVDEYNDGWDQETLNETDLTSNNPSFDHTNALNFTESLKSSLPRNRKLSFSHNNNDLKVHSPQLTSTTVVTHCCCCNNCVVHRCSSNLDIDIGFEFIDDFKDNTYDEINRPKSEPRVASGRLRRQSENTNDTPSRKTSGIISKSELPPLPISKAKNNIRNSPPDFKKKSQISPEPNKATPPFSSLASWNERNRSPITLEIENTNGSFSPGSYVLRSDFMAQFIQTQERSQIDKALEDNNAIVAHHINYISTPQAAIDDSIIKISNQMHFPLRLYIQMEVCESDTMHNWLQNSKRKILEDVNMLLWAQIVEGVYFLHENNWVHRDIKPGNIFVQLQNNFDPSKVRDETKPYTADSFPYIVKIGDFGLAKELSSHYESIDSKATKHTKGHIIGTVTYASPEQISSSSNIAFSTDIFSLGIILFEMFQHFDTAMERSRLLAAARKFEFPDSFISQHPDVHRLVCSMLQTNSSLRPSAKQLILDPYVKNFIRQTDISYCRNEALDKDNLISSLLTKNESLLKHVKYLEKRIIELESKSGNNISN